MDRMATISYDIASPSVCMCVIDIQVCFQWSHWPPFLEFIHKGPIDDWSVLSEVMVWRCAGDNPFMLWTSSLTYRCVTKPQRVNTLRPRQDGRRLPDDTFERIFFEENVRISIKISLNFAPKSPIDNIPALFQIMAWRRSGDKPSSEPMMVKLPTHKCVARPQWIKKKKSNLIHLSRLDLAQLFV